MSKVNLFDASKTMAERVGAFMRVKVWGITLKARLDAKIADAETKIDNLKEIALSTGKDYSDDIDILESTIVVAKAEYEKAVEEGEKFELTENDKAFYKKYKNGEVVDGMIEWFAFYGLEVDDKTELVQELCESLKGARKLGGRAIVRANAEKFTDNVRTKNDVLTVFYGRLAEKMMVAGTLKAEAIPEDVREMYAPKKKNKK